MGCAVTKLALISLGIESDIFSFVLPKSIIVHFGSRPLSCFEIAIIPSTGIVKIIISQDAYLSF